MSDEVQMVLSRSLAEYLEEVLINHDDEGPYDEGWKSEELIELINTVRRTLGKEKMY